MIACPICAVRFNEYQSMHKHLYALHGNEVMTLCRATGHKWRYQSKNTFMCDRCGSKVHESQDGIRTYSYPEGHIPDPAPVPEPVSPEELERVHEDLLEMREELKPDGT